MRPGPVQLLAATAFASASCVTTTIIKVSPTAVCPAAATGQLVVRVHDSQDLPLPGMRVTLTGQRGGSKKRQQTDTQGLTVFHSLPADGACSLRAESPGFEVTLAKDMPCRPDCETTVGILMNVDLRKLETVT